ncbi:MAG TPA: hypothetical protein VM843_02265 [Flavisolibacter sp.]|jgi:hypothetical protein|nr:hypothetical protein [Flavisolibacter sp.]
MKNILFFLLIAGLLLPGCTKEGRSERASDHTSSSTPGFIKYTLKQGEHFTDANTYKPVELTELKFAVKFDSSAIYKSIVPENQYDINKLYGFSDNDREHQQFSARFGWRWSDGALRLFAYVYNDGVVTSKELVKIAIGAEVVCSIRVAGDAYIFAVDGQAFRMPRTSTTPTGKGYQLYPYFGGDEAAPHDVTILIKNL